jgi:hypothetical protein
MLGRSEQNSLARSKKEEKREPGREPPLVPAAKKQTLIASLIKGEDNEQQQHNRHRLNKNNTGRQLEPNRQSLHSLQRS